MLRVDRGVITKVAINWYCQADVLAASTLAFLYYDEMAAVARSCQTGRALMHAPLFANPSMMERLWPESCEMCSWVNGHRRCFECENCGLNCCLDCLEPGNVCIICRIDGAAPLPTVVPMHLHAYYMSCQLYDALTRSGDYYCYRTLDFLDEGDFAWPYQLNNWLEWLPFALRGKDIEEGTPAELWPDTDDGF